jgi:hypothetical protein
MGFLSGVFRVDLNFDYPPYCTYGCHHINLLIETHVVTSALMVIHRSKG